jgi:hypothetical protein
MVSLRLELLLTDDANMMEQAAEVSDPPPGPPHEDGCLQR